jgi:hypothetical protein
MDTKNVQERAANLAAQEKARADSLALLLRLRREASDASEEISRLITFLDASDEYAMTELEDDDDREPIGDEEPSLGSFNRMVCQDKSWRQVFDCDVPEVDAELDTADDEPSLASPERHPTVPHTSIGYFGGLVLHEPEEERRDSTGSQVNWASGAQ